MRLFRGIVCVTVLLATTFCAYSEEPLDSQGELNLKILHINDHHSHLAPNMGANLKLLGEDTKVEMGGFPRLTTKIRELSADHPHTLKLHAGDAITGTPFYALLEGEADAKLMNEICFDAFALGNHEFDLGEAALQNFLDHLNAGACHTPALAANVVPEVGTPLAPSGVNDYIKPYIIKELGIEEDGINEDGINEDVKHKVGIIGIDIVTKTVTSSNPSDTTRFLDEVATAQKYIDELEAQGINKIILMTHYQYANDLLLAEKLHGVDVIVGGDSHSLLGYKFQEVGLHPEGRYPTQKQDAAGNKVCIVQAWQYSNVLGELDVTFDASGRVKSCMGTPHLLLGDTFSKLDETSDELVPVDSATHENILQYIEMTKELSIVVPDPHVQEILGLYQTQVENRKSLVIGSATQPLCLAREPGENKDSTVCTDEEVYQTGSDITHIVARAFRDQSNRAQVAILNADGVRKAIPAGDITVNDVYELLPLANTLVNLELTGKELKTVLEDALSYTVNPQGSLEAYPYAWGLRWHVNMTNPRGTRITKLEAKPKGALEWFQVKDDDSYIVVTTSAIATGKDGYRTFGNVKNREDTFMEYAGNLLRWLKNSPTLKKPSPEEYSTQVFINKNGINHGDPTVTP